MTSRRQFVGAGAAIVAGTMVPSWLRALPTGPAARRLTAETWLPEPPPAELFQKLALAAMDAAKAAGAEFADVRIGVQRSIIVPQLPFPPRASLQVGYGIRARVQGTWGFQHGSVLTQDAVVSVARSAVTGARRYAAVNADLGRHVATDLAPAPVVTGEWRGPMEIDPFRVSMDDYYRAMNSVAETAARVHRNGDIRCGGLNWRGEIRVFASTDGSLVTQHFTRGGVGNGGGASLPENTLDVVGVDLPGLEPKSGGFELALRPDLNDYLMTGLADAILLRELPVKRFQDIGRFPIIFEGISFANLVALSASMAIDGDRAWGTEADASGMSFLSPPDEVLNAEKPHFSPLLTIDVNRSLPSTVAAQWDDEGVVPQPYTIVRDGRVVDYHVTRESASLLEAWYTKHGRPMRAHGVAEASSPASLPVSTPGHLFISPSKTRATVKDLMKDMDHGFVVRGISTNTESSLTGGTIGTRMVVEVEKGKPVARTSISMQFATKSILGSKLVALGDTSTIRQTAVQSHKGTPWQDVSSPVTAPAALCKDVDVITWVLRR